MPSRPDRAPDDADDAHALSEPWLDAIAPALEARVCSVVAQQRLPGASVGVVLPPGLAFARTWASRIRIPPAHRMTPRSIAWPR